MSSGQGRACHTDAHIDRPFDVFDARGRDRAGLNVLAGKSRSEDTGPLHFHNYGGHVICMNWTQTEQYLKKTYGMW
jgi:hypothetical protein